MYSISSFLIYLVSCQLNSLSLGPLQSTDVVIHLANRSVAYLASCIEDVLVQVGELIFLVDFYVLNMGEVDP